MNTLADVKRIEEGGFSRVGVAYQRHREKLVDPAAAPDARRVAERTFSMAVRRERMRARMRRRSYSNCCSPGPRVPMPPPSRESSTAASAQPRQQVVQLGQFHLQLSFAAPGAAGKNIQNQLGPVDHPQVQLALEVAQLGGREVVVDDDQIGGGGVGGAPYLVQFASPQQGRRVGLRRPLEQGPHDARPRPHRQLAQFAQANPRPPACRETAPD